MKQKILIFLLFVFAVGAKAQDTEFWFVAPDVEDTAHNDSPVMFAVSNTVARVGNVTLTLYRGGGTPATYTKEIPAEGVVTFDFPKSNLPLVENPRSSAGNVTRYGIHISSTVPVTAYYQVKSMYDPEIFTLKGSLALGKEFYVPMLHDSYYTTAGGNTYDQIDIVATVDGTQVTVNPTAQIRIGTSGSSSAGTIIVRTLNKGETLKIMEYAKGNPTLAATKITATEPIAVTTSEDVLAAAGGGLDLIGDQIIPVDALGSDYAVVKGFLVGSDRAYMIATENGTTITVNNGSTITSSGLLNAGDCWVFNLGNGGYTNTAPRAVYITANRPFYCYHASGSRALTNTADELGSALIPSMQSIGQGQLSFYQDAVGSNDMHYVFVIFRTGSHLDFNIKSQDEVFQPLSGITPIPIPGISEWQTAKIQLPSSYRNKAVTINNTSSPFSLGYFSNTNGGGSYGYLSAFGSFRFPYDKIYKCLDDAYTLFAGFADSYKWEYSTTKSGPYTTLSETGHSLTVTDEGYYRLEMVQNSHIVSDIVQVVNLDLHPSISQSTTSGQTAFSSSVNQGLIDDDPNLELSYLWEFDGGTSTTSTEKNPLVTWTGKKLTAKLMVTGEANSASSTGECTSEAVYMYLLSEVDVCMQKANITIDGDFTLPNGTSAYQWQSSKDNVLWNDITGETSSSFTIPILSQKHGVTYYRVLLSDGTKPAVATKSARIRFKSCRLPVNHNISVMEYYD